MPDIITDGFVAPDGQVYIYRDGRLPNAPATDGRMLTSEGGVMLWQKGDVSRLDGVYYPNAVSDYDGNWYDAVIIGDKVWTVQNLRVKHFPDGTVIDYGGTSSSDYSVSIPYYYYPNNSTTNERVFGLLYNWPAILNGESPSDNNPSGVQGIAPIGWHVPSYSELQELQTYIGSQKRHLADGSTSEKIAKALASISGWDTSNVVDSVGLNTQKNNSSLFSGKAAGYRTNAVFSFGKKCLIASSTEWGNATYRCMSFDYNETGVSSFTVQKFTSSSVRCVCDLSPSQFRAWYVETYRNANLTPDIHDVVYCTFNFDSGSTTNGTMDMTSDEINQHIQNGKNVLCKINGSSKILSYVNTNTPMFTRIYGTSTSQLQYNSSNQKWVFREDTLAISSSAISPSINTRNNPCAVTTSGGTVGFGLNGYREYERIEFSDGVTYKTIGFSTISLNFDRFVILDNTNNTKDVSITIGTITVGSTECDNTFKPSPFILKAGSSIELTVKILKSYTNSTTGIVTIGSIGFKTINNQSILGSGNLDITTPLYDNGTRILIDSDGLHSVDLTDRSVTIINFADGVTAVQINFTLNATGDRVVVLKRANNGTSVLFSINNISSNLSSKILNCYASSVNINNNNPRVFTVMCRKIDEDVYFLESGDISQYTNFGASSSASWTPPVS